MHPVQNSVEISANISRHFVETNFFKSQSQSPSFRVTPTIEALPAARFAGHTIQFQRLLQVLVLGVLFADARSLP